MAQHTPGPWLGEIDTPWNERPRVYATGPVGRTGKLIAIVGNAEAPTEHQDEWDANSRLIAASPELLTALKDLLIMSDKGGEPRKLDEAMTWRQNDMHARKQAIDAIAKAEGRS